MWSVFQDWKFYNAEGGRKRAHWSLNSAFRNGALQGYQAHSGMLATLGNTMSAREIIVIEDSGSDSESGDEHAIPAAIEDWVQKTQAATQSLKYFDLETSKWRTKEEDLSDNFLAELRDMVCSESSRGPEMDGDTMAEDAMGVPKSDCQNMASNLPSNGPVFDTTSNVVIKDVGAGPSRDHPKLSKNLLHELCADVLRMHGDEASNIELAANDMEIEYEYSWTGI